MLSYEQRGKLCQNPTAKLVFDYMSQKETNLALSIDLIKMDDILQLADCIGPEICILKTHVDIIEDFDFKAIKQLAALAKQHKFVIFEDRKFADIGNTVKLQYSSGIFRISQWAQITNAHTVPGPSIIEGLKQVGLPLGNGLLLLAEMSSRGSLAQGEYTNKTLQMALQHRDFVIGFITQKKLIDDPLFLNMTPGVQIGTISDNIGQQYATPWQAIFENESDIIIVGRGIYAQDDPLKAAKTYRELGWEAYLQRVKNNTTA